MEHDTKDLVAMAIVDKREVGLKSTNMEKEGLLRVLRDVQESGLAIGELVTDAHVQIASVLSKCYIFRVVLVLHWYSTGSSICSYN